MPRQLWIKTTALGQTEINHHTVNWATPLAKIQDTIVDAWFDTTNEDLKIHWENFTEFDTTLCLNGNNVPTGKYFAGHNVKTASGLIWRRTVLVRVVQR